MQQCKNHVNALLGNMPLKIANVPFPFQSAPSNRTVLIPSGAMHTKRNNKDASQLVYVTKLYIQEKKNHKTSE